MLGVYLRVSIALKRHHDHGNSYKGSHFIGAGLQFRGLVHHHGRKHGDMQADMVLEKELRVLHLALQAAGRNGEIELLRPQNLLSNDALHPTKPHLLQGHTS